MSGYLTRFELDADKEGDDGFLYAEGRGRSGENRPDILNLQNYGFASRPPVGSVGNKLAMGGRNSTPLIFGLEHPQYRPKIGAGQVALYDQYGNIMKYMDEGIIIDYQSRTIEMTGGQWNITGDVTITGNLHVDGDITTTGVNPNNHSH